MSRMYLLATIVFIFAPILIFAQETPKKPTKLTEDTVNQICNEVISKHFNEERQKFLEESKRLIEEAIKASQEENKKTLEELEKRIIEATDKNIQEKSKDIATEVTKEKIEEYDKQRKQAEKIKAISGPGWVYDEDTVLKLIFETLIRTEIGDNATDYNSATDDSEMKILQRTVFGANINYKDRLSGTYKLRHTQIWGDQNQYIFVDTKDTNLKIPTESSYSSLYKENHGLGTYEAFIEIGNFRNIPLTLQAGLIQLHYGDGRFIGSNKGWFIEAEPSTAAILKYRVEGHNFHLIYSKIRESEFVRLDKLYKTPGDDLIGLYYTTSISDDIHIDGYGFYNRIGPNALSTSGKDINIGTFGIRTDSTFSKLKLNAELMFQFGKNQDRDHIAGAADVIMKYHLPLSLSPYIWGGFAYATGDSGSKEKSLQFIQIYGSNELRYGILHLTELSNIILPRGGIGLYPFPRLNIALNYYYFILASSKGFVYNASHKLALYDPTGNNGRNFGWETDIIIKFAYNKNLILSLGYALSQPLDYQINQESYIYKDAYGKGIVFGNDFVHYGFGMIQLQF